MGRTQRMKKWYAKLGVTPEDVASSVKVTPILRRVKNCKDANGDPQDPVKFAVDCLRSSDSPDARAFLAVYDAPDIVQSIRDEVPIEAFILKSGVDPSRLLGAYVQAAFQQAVQVGQVIAATHHAQIVEMSASLAASSPLHIEDRGWQLKNMGFLPVPKGQATSINVNVQQNTATVAALPPAVTPEDRILKLSDRFNESKPLAPATPVHELAGAVEAEYLEVEDD